MSANNYISILHPLKSQWEVWMQDAETDAFMGKPLKAKSLKQAIKKALEFMKNEEVEYGIRIIDI